MIGAAVEDAREFGGLADANIYLDNLCRTVPGFLKQANNVYRYKDYFINVGVRFLMAGHATNLMTIADWNLSCAPEGIAEVWLNNDHDMVLVTRIKCSENRRIIPFSATKPDKEVHHQAKLRLLEDVDRLAERGYACSAVTENPKSWYFLEGDNRIIISDWKLAWLPEKAREVYRNRVIKILGTEE